MSWDPLSGWRSLGSRQIAFIYVFIYWSFLGPHLWHMEVPRLGSYRSCSHWPIPEPQQYQIRAVSATYTTAPGNAKSLTHWARLGIKPAASWFLVRFVNWATMGTPGCPFFNSSESLLLQCLEPARITDLSLCQTGISKMLKVLQSKLSHILDHRY